jgi:hypothetical protein
MSEASSGAARTRATRVDGARAEPAPEVEVCGADDAFGRLAGFLWLDHPAIALDTEAMDPRAYLEGNSAEGRLPPDAGVGGAPHEARSGVT